MEVSGSLSVGAQPGYQFFQQSPIDPGGRRGLVRRAVPQPDLAPVRIKAQSRLQAALQPEAQAVVGKPLPAEIAGRHGGADRPVQPGGVRRSGYKKGAAAKIWHDGTFLQYSIFAEKRVTIIVHKK